jgi:hypothetical protein
MRLLEQADLLCRAAEVEAAVRAHGGEITQRWQDASRSCSR